MPDPPSSTFDRTRSLAISLHALLPVLLLLLLLQQPSYNYINIIMKVFAAFVVSVSTAAAFAPAASFSRCT